MKLFLNVLVCLALWICLQTASLAQTPAGKEIVGIWQAKLTVSGVSIRLIVHVNQSADGALTATLDSPDQGANGLPVSKVTYAKGALHLDASAIGITIDGQLSADGKQIDGTLKQGSVTTQLTFVPIDHVEEHHRPQDPKRPYPYVEREVAYENKSAGIKLAGTLTLPPGKGPFPAVLLITGSGAQNRDEELLGHRPFLVLSDYLTRRGIAVLRVDDRGMGGSTGSTPMSTTADFVGDVLTGVAFLKTQKEIDPKQIGLIGHSEGGIIAPMAAAQSKDIAFIVLMAGTGLRGDQIIYLQGALIAKAMGASEEAVAKERATQEQMFAIVEQNKDTKAIEQKLDAIVQKQLEGLQGDEKKQAEDKAKVQMKELLTPWFRYFLTLDPQPYLRKVHCPVLAINGSKDLQVPPKENLPAITKALQAAGNKDFQTVELPGLNHLFQTCTTGSPGEYTKIEETIAPLALQTMGDWIAKHTHQPKP